MNSTRRFARLGFTVFAVLVPCTRAVAQAGPSIFPAPVHGGSLQEFTDARLVVGDLTGDGLPDSVLGINRLDGGTDSLLIQLGNAHGGLGAPTHLGIQSVGGSNSMAIGDLTGDGIGDLAISGYLTGPGFVLSVFAGTPQGTLSTPVHYPRDSFGYQGALAIGDVTGDGRNDVVVVEEVDKNPKICVRAGNAQGTLDPAVCYPPMGTTEPRCVVAIGDVDGDGRLDVVNVTSSLFYVFRGNAQGTLDPPVVRQSCCQSRSTLAFGDVTGDGRADAVLADAGRTMVCVFAGTALGALEPGPCYASSVHDLWSIAVGDLDADGRADVAALGMGVVPDAGLVCVLKGNPGGTLDAPVTYVPGLIRPLWDSLEIADLGADGRVELIIANQIANDLCVLESDGQGGFEVADAEPSNGFGRLALGDVSGDGRLDVVQAQIGEDSVCVLAGNPQGSLEAAVCYPAGAANPDSIATGELTGDTFQDVVVSTNGGVCVLAGNAQGSLDPAVCYPGTSGRLAVGDVSGDSRPDLVVSTSTGVCVMKGNAQGTLDAPACIPGPEGELALADVTSDGRLDAVVAHSPSFQSAEVCVLAGNVLGGFDAPVCYPAGAYDTTDLAIGDVNGDGWPDVVVTKVQGSDHGEGCVLLGNANGTLDPASCDSNFGGGVDVGDVNADGVADVVVGYFNDDSDGAPVGVYVGVREGNPSSTSSTAIGSRHPYASGASMPSYLVLGDVTGDGRPDAVVPGRFYTQTGVDVVAVLENQFPSLGTISCLGDSACPCANAGVGERGCENSSSTGGARLFGDGVASLAEDTVRLFASGEKPSALTIFLQGDATIPAMNFGDGRRCAGGALKRLYAKSASSGAVTAPLPGDLSVSARSAALGDPLSAGDVRVYQTWYRDPNPAFCAAPTGNTSNASNSLTVTWSQ